MKENKISKKEIISYIAIIIVIILLKTFIVTPILVNGSSMNDTLLNKDILLLNKFTYRINDIKRFDIVVLDNETDYIIKRIIGLPGEKVKYEDNKLYINGKEVEEKFSHASTEDFEVKVPKNKYFVLGDNRVVSVDSRVLGSFSKKEILGKATYVIFPFKRFGLKK